MSHTGIANVIILFDQSYFLIKYGFLIFTSATICKIFFVHGQDIFN